VSSRKGALTASLVSAEAFLEEIAHAIGNRMRIGCRKLDDGVHARPNSGSGRREFNCNKTAVAMMRFRFFSQAHRRHYIWGWQRGQPKCRLGPAKQKLMG
jgi:hypothetical protein